MIALSLVVKATLILAAGLAAARLARHARASVRHVWLAATFTALALLPIVAVTAPPMTVAVPEAYAAIAASPASPADAGSGPQTAPVFETAESSPVPRTAARLSWTAILQAIWIAGALATMASLLLSVARVRRIRRDGLPRTDLARLLASLAADAGVSRTIDLLEHERVPAPLTSGLWRPAIVLPRDAREWSDADVRRALLHELEHIARGDWGVQLAARFVCAAYWFHPLAWSALRALCLDAERACDDAVLRSEDRADYADQLVLLARRFTTAHARPLVGMANRSDLSARVTAVLDDRLRRGHAGARAALGAFAAATLLAVAIAPIHAIAAPREADLQRGASPGAAGQPRSRETRRATALDRALLEAAAEGDAETMDRLLQAGANVNAAVDGDGSPLIAAARTGRLAIVKTLLDRGADPNLAVEGDGAPLIAAAAAGATTIAALLLDRGANIELVVPGDENALIQASASGHLATVKLLVGRGANVNARVWVETYRPGERGEYRTPLSMARRGRHAAVVEFLVASGARD